MFINYVNEEEYDFLRFHVVVDNDFDDDEDFHVCIDHRGNIISR